MISVEYIRVMSAPGVDMTTCITPCTPSGIIAKWKNDGDTDVTFVPKVIVTNIDSGMQIEMGTPGGTVMIPAHYTSPPMAIYLPTLGIGTYTFCPNENPTNVCKTVVVTGVPEVPIEPPPTEAGMDGILVLGLGIGILYFMLKSKR